MMSPSQKARVVEKRRLMRVFRKAAATSPKGTILPEEYSLEKGKLFQRMVKRGILKETSSGWYYLDENRLAYLKRKDGINAIIVLVGIIVVALSIFLIVSHNSWK